MRRWIHFSRMPMVGIRSCRPGLLHRAVKRVTGGVAALLSGTRGGRATDGSAGRTGPCGLEDDCQEGLGWSLLGRRGRRPGAGRRRRLGGFTMIEMIGALMILSVLLSVLVPVVLRDLERRHRRLESDRLVELAEALVRSVERLRTIPDHTGMAAAIAAESGYRVEQVRTNHTGVRRLFLIDPRLRIGTNANSVLPYTQTVLGALQPVMPRVLIVSSLSAPLPDALVDGVAASTSVFDELWNLAPNTVPATWSGWSGDGLDLKVQRINLMECFLPLVLNSMPAAAGRYSLDGGTGIQLPTNPHMTFVIRSTVVDLRDTGGQVQTREVLQTPGSYAYEHGIWRGRLFLGAGQRRLSGLDLQAAVELFLNSPSNPNAKPFNNPTTTAKVVDDMRAYMIKYMEWASAGFPTTTAGRKPVRDAQSDLASSSKNLLFKP